MKKLALLGVIGLALAGCQTTGSFEQHSYQNNHVPHGTSITLQDTKNSVWRTRVKNDAFDGKKIYSSVYSGNAELLIRYNQASVSEIINHNGIAVIYANGDNYICSGAYDYENVDILVDGKRHDTVSYVADGKTAVFLYQGDEDRGEKDWLSILAKGKRITLRMNDSCGSFTENTFNITGWPKEFFNIQNPKIEEQAHLSNTGLDEFMYLTEGKHNEWCSYAKSVNYAEGQNAFSLFNKFWNTREMRQYRLTTQTASERTERMLAWTALLEKRTGKLIPPSSEYFVYSKEMCAKL